MHYFDESAIYLMHALSAVKDRDRFSSSICDSNRPLSLPCRVMGILRFPEKKGNLFTDFFAELWISVVWLSTHGSDVVTLWCSDVHRLQIPPLSSSSSCCCEGVLELSLIWIFENFLVLCSWFLVFGKKTNKQCRTYACSTSRSAGIFSDIWTQLFFELRRCRSWLSTLELD